MASITYRYTASGEVEFVASRDAAQRYPWHLHAAHWVSGVVLSGGLVLETRAEARYLRTGGYFRIPRLCAHRLFLEPGTTLLAACLPTNSSILPYDARLAGLVRKACAPLALGARAEHLARHLLHAQPPEESTAEPPIQTVCRLLLDDPATPWPLKRLAALAGYSPWHFLRRFRRETGLTPHAFHLLCRLRLARALLRADTAAAEAAVSAGFTDQSHLHKLFRRQRGMTPGQFRRASLRLEA